jgi:hypothetical protein
MEKSFLVLFFQKKNCLLPLAFAYLLPQQSAIDELRRTS